MKPQFYRRFTEEEHRTWGVLYRGLERNRKTQAVPLFSAGLAYLEIGPDRIPDLGEINRRLGTATGWRGVAVEGYEAPTSFYPALARREYPVGNFIRDVKAVSYTPEPDVFHDLYGHLPFLFDEKYADFCARYGERASKHVDDPVRLRCYERFFWFTMEFGLIRTPEGRRIFGAGLLSSKAESDYALSDGPTVKPFDLQAIVAQEFLIDRFQDRLFLLDHEDQVYGALDQLEAAVETQVERERNKMSPAV